MFRQARNAVVFFLFVAILISPVAHAVPQIEVREAQLTAQQIQELGQKIHESAEAENPLDSTLTQFLSKLNLKRAAINRIRTYHLYKNQHEETAFNLVFLLGVSHATETLSGPIYLLYGLAQGHRWEVLAPTASALLSQALPGIDFMCIVLAGTYIGSQDFRELTGTVRVYTVKGVTTASQFMGVTAFMKKLVDAEPANDYLRRTLGAVSAASEYRYSSALAPQVDILDEVGKPMATLDLAPVGSRRLTLTSLRLRADGWTDERRALLRRRISPFGWDVYDAIEDVSKHHAIGKLDVLAGSPFIEQVARWENGKMEAEILAGHEWIGCSCSHGHVHAPGETCDHHHLAEEAKVIPVTLEPGEVQVHFRKPAIQIAPSYTFHPGRAVRALPGISATVACNMLDATCNLPITTIAFFQHLPGVTVRMVAGTPWAAWKGVRIGGQVSYNVALGIKNVGQFVVNTTYGCGKWLRQLLQ